MSRASGPLDDGTRRGQPTLHGEIVQQIRLVVAETPEEVEVLQMIRSGEYERVEVTSPNGEIETIRTTLRPDAGSPIKMLLQQHPFQNLNLSVKDGEVVSISQEVTTSPGGALVRSKRGGGRSTQLSHQRVRFPNRSDRRRHLSPELDGADADPRQRGRNALTGEDTRVARRRVPDERRGAEIVT